MGFTAAHSPDSWQPPTSYGLIFLLHLANGLLVIGWVGAVAWVITQLAEGRR